MLSIRIATRSMFAVGPLALLFASACSAGPGSESDATGTSSQAIILHVLPPPPPPPTSIWDVVTNFDPTHQACAQPQYSLPVPPELAGEGCLLGAAQGEENVEPMWACPATAAIPHSLTTQSVAASALEPCVVNAADGGVSLPPPPNQAVFTHIDVENRVVGVTDCAVVYTLTSSAPAAPTCFGNIADPTRWVFVWQHDYNNPGYTCEAMGCGGPCPNASKVIPH